MTFFPDNCAINEETGDGVRVGRCWHHLLRTPEGRWRCPRHGDVTAVRDRFIRTGKLTRESEDVIEGRVSE